MSWTNFVEMPWMKLQTDLNEWRQAGSDKAHAIYALPGVNLWTKILDILHVCYKGVVPCVIGSALFCLVWDSALRGTVHERTQIIFSDILIEYERQGVPLSERISHMTYSMICGSEARNPPMYPQFHGQGIKAAHHRHIIGPVRAVIEKYNTEHKLDHLWECVRLMERSFLLLEAHGQYLPEDVAEECFEYVHGCCVHYAYLAQHASSQGQKLFLIIPKFHLWLHLAWNCRYYNARFGWTFMDEDFMGKVAQIAKASVFGLGPLRLGATLVRRYLITIALRFHRRRKYKIFE